MADETHFGHDPEFRGLFAEEAEGRLDALAASLLDLETGRDGEALLAALLREAHSIKGASSMVGLPDVTAVAHALEDLLFPYRDSGGELPTRTIDMALATVDGLRAVIRAAGAGEEHATAAGTLVARLAAAQVVDAMPAQTASPAPPINMPAEPAIRSEATTVGVPVARLDQLFRLVAESASALRRTGRALGAATGRDPQSLPEYRELTRNFTELQELTMRTRMVPVATIAQPLQRAVREVARALGKEVRWELAGGDTEIDRRILDQLADPLLHLVRNAVDHGIEPADEREAAGKPRHGTIRLHAAQRGSEIVLSVTDDGRGVDRRRVRAAAERGGAEAGDDPDSELRAIFRPGLSTAATTTDISGRGVGLDVVQDRLASVRGRVEVHSVPGQGCEFVLAVPITLAVIQCMVVRCGGTPFAIPMHAVLTSVALEGGRAERAGGRDVVRVGERVVPLARLDAVIERPDGATGGGSRAIVLISDERTQAFRVDALLGVEDVVITRLSDLLPRLDIIAGSSIEADGSVLLVLEPSSLVERAQRTPHVEAPAAEPVASPSTPPRRSVLVVDDAVVTRELERTMLEQAGYEVRVAADGAAALVLLGERPSDVVLTDIDMPRLDGFELTRHIRAHPTLRHSAIVILSSRESDDDRLRALDLGADAYIVKRSFDRGSLIAAVERLVGAP